MNRNKMTLLSVAAAVLMACALMGSVWFAYFSGGGASFELPPPLSPGSLPGDASPGLSLGGQSFTPLTVDARNVQVLLATVERPAAYRMTVDCVTYWPGGEETVTRHLAHREGLTRLETVPEQNRLITPARTYVWTGAVIHEVFPEGVGAEALAGIPTWEDIISLPAESILLAEYLYMPGARMLRIQTQEAVYQGEYVLSLETGLLVRAAFTDAYGLLAYEVKTQGPPVVGDPGDEWFTLPDGRLITVQPSTP
jgi:hypothetical protein